MGARCCSTIVAGQLSAADLVHPQRQAVSLQYALCGPCTELGLLAGRPVEMDIPGLSQLAKQLHGRCPHRQSASGIEHKRARKDLCQHATLTHAQHALLHAISELFGWLLNELLEQICDVARMHA